MFKKPAGWAFSVCVSDMISFVSIIMHTNGRIREWCQGTGGEGSEAHNDGEAKGRTVEKGEWGIDAWVNSVVEIDSECIKICFGLF